MGIPPNRYIEKLAKTFFPEPNDQNAFIYAVTAGNSAQNAVIRLEENHPKGSLSKPEIERIFFEFAEKISADARPGKSEEHESGKIYCLDTSSVFAASVLLGVEGKVNNILDVCASPGGKAITAWRNFQPEFLMCNETISKRCPALIHNLKRCKISPVGVTCFDTEVLAQRYADVFKVVIVDAPCSGQSLLAKGMDSPGAFHPATINLNSNRQKRIFANSLKCLQPGGFIAYMTCTFSYEENEKVIAWVVKKFPWLKVKEVSALSEFASAKADFSCYRLWPQSGIGAGAFAAILHDERDGQCSKIDFSNEKFIWRQNLSENSSADEIQSVR